MKIGLPPSANTSEYRALIPATVKRLYGVSVIVLAILSGQPQLFVHAREITPQQSAIPVAQHTRHSVSVNTTRISQIALVSIGKEKYIAPTAVPKPEGAVNSSANALLQALNTYRQKNGKGVVSWDKKLGNFAQERADLFHRINDLDGHAGFNDLIHNHNGFTTLGFWALAENSAIGQSVTPQQLIEDVYGKSPGHNTNELNGEYTHVGIGVNGTATDFVFGGRKQ